MAAEEAPPAALAEDPAPAPQRRSEVVVVLRTAVVVLLALLLLAGAGLGALLGTGWYLARGAAGPKAPAVEDPPALIAENRRLEKKIEKMRPKGLFLIVDTGRNRLTVRDGERVAREVVVSCGSGGVLEDPKGGRTWVFDTPRGERQVKSKARHPTWIKPDWAFIEEGEEIPKKYDDRAEEGVLGDYALGIGNGYFLHGTLYTRLLGRNVTHGCVRIGDADLEYLYKTVPLGTKVYIF
ncbi:MAG TPA: L,D-transpeptidase [Candidatus Methanoperedens sp.]|nr:L,D-transpeptidase [Candidatus Methanoperedens sp.]